MTEKGGQEHNQAQRGILARGAEGSCRVRYPGTVCSLHHSKFDVVLLMKQFCSLICFTIEAVLEQTFRKCMLGRKIDFLIIYNDVGPKILKILYNEINTCT